MIRLNKDYRIVRVKDIISKDGKEYTAISVKDSIYNKETHRFGNKPVDIICNARMEEAKVGGTISFKTITGCSYARYQRQDGRLTICMSVYVDVSTVEIGQPTPEWERKAKEFAEQAYATKVESDFEDSELI